MLNLLPKERGRRKQAEARARKLDEQLKFARKNRFGDKRQKAKKNGRKEEDADRGHEKDGNYPIDNNIAERTIHFCQENPVKNAGGCVKSGGKQCLSEVPDSQKMLMILSPLDFTSKSIRFAIIMIAI